MVQNVVLFQGVDATGEIGLWETNGTASGTFELTPITGADASGLSPSNLTVFNGEVLFEGKNSSGDIGLWETNGTASGTFELAPITGANTTGVPAQHIPPGLSPSNLTVFNGEVLFDGFDSNDRFGLWVTNGTAGGTQEIGGVPGTPGYTGIAGVSSGGLTPSDLTVFDGEVLFNGADSRSVPKQPVSGLWVTNGTAGGTVELVPGAGGVNDPLGLDPADLTVFGNEVLFRGVDASGKVGLWETNGTAVGTHEITGIADANASGLNPSDLTVLGGEALFSGLDASGDTGLWVTDGIPADTHEVTGITGADPGDPTHGDPGLDPLFLTAFNGEVLFNGRDTSGLKGLWVTDGTKDGTHELLAAATGATLTSDPSGLDPSNFEIFNGMLLFSGKDANGNSQLWETNGKVGGVTQEVIGIPGAPTKALAPFDLTTSPNFSDILWQNSSSGNVQLWNSNGSGGFTGQDLGVHPGWQIEGAGDFNGSFVEGILWQN